MAPINLSDSGRLRRLWRILRRTSGRTIIVPVDDSLIFGPFAGLENVNSKLDSILEDPPDAILGFPGIFRHYSLPSTVGSILNLTASSRRSTHTRKRLVGSVLQAVQLGIDAVAVHVNTTSKFESEMLAGLGAIGRDCASLGMPLVAIMYPRSENESGDNNYELEKQEDRKAYAALVAHAARVGVDLGADLVKTQYTGDPESFRRVVVACSPVPVVVAGGPLVDVEAAFKMTHDVIAAGGAGVSFGRNVFSRNGPQPFISALKGIIHSGQTPSAALEQFNLLVNSPKKPNP